MPSFNKVFDSVWPYIMGQSNSLLYSTTPNNFIFSCLYKKIAYFKLVILGLQHKGVYNITFFKIIQKLVTITYELKVKYWKSKRTLKMDTMKNTLIQTNQSKWEQLIFLKENWLLLFFYISIKHSLPNPGIWLWSRFLWMPTNNFKMPKLREPWSIGFSERISALGGDDVDNKWIDGGRGYCHFLNYYYYYCNYAKV